MFNRHPHLPEVMNARPMGDTFEVGDPDDAIDTRVAEMKVLHDKVSAFSIQQTLGDEFERIFYLIYSVFVGSWQHRKCTGQTKKIFGVWKEKVCACVLHQCW